MNRRRQQAMMRRCAGLLLLVALGGLPACNAISGVGDIGFVTCALHLGAPQSTPPVGGLGGMAFNDICPKDQAIIGFEAGVISGGGAMSGLVAVCGAVRLSSSDPRAVTTERGEPLPVRGTSGSDIKKATCPPGQVVVGFASRTLTDTMSQGTFVSTLFLRCAPLVINGLPGAPATSSGPVELSMAIGSGNTDLGDAVPDTDCPAGQIAVASQGRATAVVDALGLGCAKPMIDCAAAEEE